jgi:hypothetical protein
MNHSRQKVTRASYIVIKARLNKTTRELQRDDGRRINKTYHLHAFVSPPTWSAAHVTRDASADQREPRILVYEELGFDSLVFRLLVHIIVFARILM